MATNFLWPAPDAFLDLGIVEQITDGRAHCTGIAICDGLGRPLQAFHQGQAAHFFVEFEVLEDIGVPSSGVEVHNADGLVIHGKNSFQYNVQLPMAAEPGQRLRYHQTIYLDVCPGEYTFGVGLSSTDETTYRSHSVDALRYEQFSSIEHCRIVNANRFSVGFDKRGQLRHHGLANLHGDLSFAVVPAIPGAMVRPRQPETIVADGPTIIHVTHWKAGSQWIHKILNECVPDRVVEPRLDQGQFLYWPIRRGKVYPTVYVTKEEFDRVRLPPDTRRFVIIRDLRDILVSGYFSMKISHQVVKNELSQLRPKLQQLSQEEGLIFMINEWLPSCANIQISWLAANEPLIRYEDLLDDDLAILESELLDRCGLPVARERFAQAVTANRFENLTSGRARGTEDVQAHERKGVVGDWRNHFTKRVKELFKMRFGGLLVASGYERDLNW